ncbi:hypothetical protein Cni_G05823 [Canna indica]|uniref:Leucine-rich repeat-containing N-terminal plant-type domain-containing protein n=1 Tax=Canna indica TaxID=4628 RepID=A0AAQ3K049_9LILI|nr:hypothetical protein Cni_G05823 [Canna indica]
MLATVEPIESSHASTSIFRCHDSERKALMEFKQGLRDPLSKRLSSWVVEQDCCTWEGIRCDNITGHVLVLDLRNRNRSGLGDDCDDQDLYIWSKDGYGCKWALDGDISPSLLSLQHLERLDLSGNHFKYERIPKFLGSFTKLTYLNLSGASFGGRVPYELANLSNLHHLDLSYNLASYDDTLYLEDAGWISQLTSLRHLNMNSVNLTKASNWLQTLNTLPHIQEIQLANCGLMNFAPLPHVNFTSLTTLDLSSNYGMNSSIPKWLFNITTLQHLNFGYNSMLNWNNPTSIGHLTSLRTLDVSENLFLNGFKPAALSNLCELQSLMLYEVSINDELTNLQGVFSDSCLKMSLEKLDLSDTNLNGPLPDWLGNMENLKYLSLSYNSLFGSLPASLGSLLSLQYLDMTDNDLNDTVEEGIFKQMKGLVSLHLGGNSLILSEVHFANLSSLKELDIYNNTLIFNESYYDWIPPFQLEFLDMSFCKILPRPQFPKWLATQRALYELHLANVCINDTLPNWLPSSFYNLDLSNNEITGHMPQYLPNITYLDLSNNSFSGQIPSRIGNLMPYIDYLDLSINNLSGDIPRSLCQIKSLDELHLSRNNLSGEIPNCWKNSSDVFTLDFSRNKLQGRIPKSLCNLTSLHSLHLDHNNFYGEIPPCLQSLTHLVTLDLSYNKFIGEIFTWIGESLMELGLLNLRSNAFTGNIPQLSLLASLQILDISNNNLTGTIPWSLGNLSAMKTSYWSGDFITRDNSDDVWLFMKGSELDYRISLLGLVRYIDLSNNNLFGDIPEDLGSLHGLQSLNLSRNRLIGTIPWSIDGMQQLEVLDLSINNLSGVIPSSLASLNFLNHLDLSYNNLSGRIPTGNQLQSLVDPSIYAGNPYLCGPPLVKNCTENITKGEEREDANKRIETIWLYTSIALGFITGFWTICGTLILKREWRFTFFRAIDNLYDKLHVMIIVNVRKFRR